MLRQLGRIVRPLFALGLTYYVLRRAHPAAVLESASNADVRWIALAVALTLVDRAAMAYRSVALLCTVERRPPVRALMRVFFVSTFIGTFLPASIGGDAARAYSLSRLDVPPSAAVVSVVMDRLLGVVSILLVGLFGLIVSGPTDLASGRAILLSLSIAGAVSIAASLVVFSATAAALVESIALRMPIVPVRLLAGDLTRATRAYAVHHATLATVLTGSVAVQVLRITQAYCLGRALHIDAPFGLYVALIPLILLVMLLPVSINGIGPSQAAFVWFFGRASVSEADAFALSVLFVALGIVGNLPGGILYAMGPPSPQAGMPSERVGPSS